MKEQPVGGSDLAAQLFSFSKEIQTIDCYYDELENNWIPKDRYKSVDASTRKRAIETPLIIQRATSASSRCRTCGFKIEWYALRIGRPVKDPRGRYGVITNWMHLKCSREVLNHLGLLQHREGKSPQELREKVEQKPSSRKRQKVKEPAKDEPDVPAEDVGNAVGVYEDTQIKFVKEEASKKEVFESLRENGINAPVVVEVDLTGGESSFDEAELAISMFGYAGLKDEERKEVLSVLASFAQGGTREDMDKLPNMDEYTPRVLTEQHKPPEELVFPLLPYQKEGLAWMCHQEDSDVHGGILADEMGMGKTIQMISLMLARRVKKELRMDGRTHGANLVVAPLAAILQWKQEIERFTKEGSLKILVYHGPHRDCMTEELKKHDVVITTYSTIEADYRTVVNEQKIECEYCGRLFLPEKIGFHQTYYCGPDAERTAKQNLKTVKNRVAADKAMETLKIKERGFVPTPMNVYKELLREGNREDLLQSANLWRSHRPKGELKGQGATVSSIEHPTEQESGDKVDEAALIVDDSDQQMSAQLNSTSSSSLHRQINLSKTDVQKLKVAELRRLLESSGLSTEGTKGVLADRLTNFLYKPTIKNKRISTTSGHTGGDDEDLILSDDMRRENQNKKRGKNGLKEPSIHVVSSDDSDVEILEGMDPNGVEEWGNGYRRSTRLKSLSSSSVTSSSKPGESTSCGTIPVKPSKKKLSKQSVKSKSKKMKKMGKKKHSKRGGVSTDDDVDDDSSYNEESGVSEDDDELDSSDEVSVTASKTIVSTHSKKKKGRPTKKGKAKKETEESTIEKEEKANELDLQYSPLHSITWQRIILDEAHRIKARVTSTAQSVYALKCSKYRWCLTGTPLQNRVGELYSLVRFIKYEPYAYYFCSKKKCSCKSVNYRFQDNGRCLKCDHSRMCHFSYFNRKIINPIKNYGYQGEGGIALNALKSDVLDVVMLRRTKVERAADVKLPPLEVHIRRDTLRKDERDFYEGLYKQTSIQFDTYVKSGTLLHNFAHIFDLLSRLRQAVDHPYLIVHGPLGGNQKDASHTYYNLCGICQTNIRKHPIRSGCKHTFHVACIKEYVDSAPVGANDDDEELGCPVCYVPLTVDMSLLEKEEAKEVEEHETKDETEVEEEEEVLDFSKRNENGASLTAYSMTKRRGIMSRINTETFVSSTKIEALHQELSLLEENDKDSKSIVFSQYCSMLELIEWRLKAGGIRCALFTGSVSVTSRCNILYSFNEDPEMKVLLISLKAGGEGLNLQVANNIFLMDPWWNPATEMQAIQRAHRIGQTKKVRAVRFICKDTIEERILQLQEKKQLVFDGTVGANSGSITKLTSDDLKFLFQN